MMPASCAPLNVNTIMRWVALTGMIDPLSFIFLMAMYLPSMKTKELAWIWPFKIISVG